MTEIMSTTGLTKRFGGLVAVEDLDLTVEESEILGLIGPNGSGKTTTFNLITGFLEPDGGTIRLNGRDVTGNSPFQAATGGIGRTFQETKPFGKLTVFENLLVANTRGLSVDEKLERADSLLDELQLEQVREHRGEDLSGGQKKLLEIARVLMLDPDIVLMDEPSAGVNPALMDDILDHITNINDAGRTIFVIEHDMSVIEELCDRVVVMNNGRKIATGTFEEIQQNPLVRDAYLGGT